MPGSVRTPPHFSDKWKELVKTLLLIAVAVGLAGCAAKRYSVCVADEVSGEANCTKPMTKAKAQWAAGLLEGAPGGHLAAGVVPVPKGGVHKLVVPDGEPLELPQAPEPKAGSEPI